MTEDVLSAIKVSRVPRNVGVALMGSSVSESQALRISKIADNVYIFLDNDNAEVKKNQEKARKLLEPLVKGTVQVIHADKDPKAHTTDELRELIKT